MDLVSRSRFASLNLPRNVFMPNESARMNPHATLAVGRRRGCASQSSSALHSRRLQTHLAPGVESRPNVTNLKAYVVFVIRFRKHLLNSC